MVGTLVPCCAKPLTKGRIKMQPHNRSIREDYGNLFDLIYQKLNDTHFEDTHYEIQVTPYLHETLLTVLVSMFKYELLLRAKWAENIKLSQDYIETGLFPYGSYLVLNDVLQNRILNFRFRQPFGMAKEITLHLTHFVTKMIDFYNPDDYVVTNIAITEDKTILLTPGEDFRIMWYHKWKNNAPGLDTQIAEWHDAFSVARDESEAFEMLRTQIEDFSEVRAGHDTFRSIH